MDAELIKRTQDFLFASEKEMEDARLPQPVRDRLLRLRSMYTYWLNQPALQDKAIVDEIRRKFGISLRMAYDDVRLIKICLGNLQQATSDYYRYLFLQRCEEGFQMARENADPNAFARVLACLGKYTRLDKEDGLAPDYSQIIPQTFEISADPEVAGFKRIPGIEEKARKMLERYQKEAEMAQFTDYEEIKPLTPSNP